MSNLEPERNNNNHIFADKLLTEINDLVIEINTDFQEQGLCFSGKVQEELARQINLLQRLGNYTLKLKKLDKVESEQQYFLMKTRINSIKIGINSLLNKEQKRLLEPKAKREKIARDDIILAENIRHDIEYFLDRQNWFTSIFKNPFRQIMHLSSTPIKVIFGLAIALPIYSTIFWSSLFLFEFVYNHAFINDRVVSKGINSRQLSPSLNDNPLPSPSGNKEIEVIVPKLPPSESSAFTAVKDQYILVISVALAGAMGSIISILTRINEYQESDYGNSFLPILIGAFKPAIGASFGILTFAMISSGIIPIQVPQADNFNNNTSTETVNSNPKNPTGRVTYFFFSLAFAVGFSERLAQDIVSRANSVIPSSQDSKMEDNK